MFDAEHFKHLNYIKKEPLSGSFKGMRYLIEKWTIDEDTKMRVTVWPEPFGYAKTPEEQKTRSIFTLDQDGLTDAVSWLNAQYENFR